MSSQTTNGKVDFYLSKLRGKYTQQLSQRILGFFSKKLNQNCVMGPFYNSFVVRLGIL